ncbi:tubulin monoglutamylase TTLL4-like isoform X5 [Bolinopsis microptera]|uniref:tubulin monoglutamylase TTLL4-like isoform X5 n=1 Tax=Bolinopsis microptera TaxID=2820187 RepID=UPI00307AF8E8
MDKKETRKNQHPFPCRLLPLQNLKQDVKFCSLAELKTCIDSAQLNSLQKESKDSILKLLEGDIRSSDIDSKCLSLWKNGRKKPPSVPWETCKLKNKGKVSEKKNSPPQEAAGSFKRTATLKVPNDVGKIISNIPVKPPAITAIKAKPKGAKYFKQPSHQHQLSDHSFLSQADTVVTATTSTSLPYDEDYAESTLPSELDDYQTCSEFDFKDDNNDEFDELSDIDGDDSAVVSQCNSSLSWTSLDAKQDEVSESVTTTDSGLGSDADISTHLPITQSHFKHCPPVLYFPAEHEKVSKLPRALQKQLKWKMSTITPNVVKNVIARTGFVPSTNILERREWIGYWGKHMKAAAFRNIHPHQKVNHYPGTFEIGRKDKLWKNLNKAQIKHSKKEYDFIPLTFCLPSEWKTFKRYWDESGHKQKWIIKPPASARGIGIKVIHKLNQIPRKRNIIIQRYLASPYLINGRKFDLRIYVYVSSYDPLCIYMYDNGLVRFASSKYSHSSKSLSNRYVHLTNYSVNKFNDAYIKNEDETGTESHKWGLKALWKYLQVAGQDVEGIKAKIKNIVVKTIIASVPTVTSLSKSHCKYRHTCHELFGFDIFLDQHLKPWIIEVNISPSLHTSAPLDKHIKYGLVKDLFNTAGFLVPQTPTRTRSTAPSSRGPHSGTSTPAGGNVIVGGRQEGCNGENNDNVTDKQLYFNPGIQLSSDEKAKHAYFAQKYPTDGSVSEKILDTLTPDDIRVLMKFEDEISRRGELELIFPTESGGKYLKYFVLPKFYDLLVLQWIKKYAKDPHRGVARLQKLAESQVQFTRTPTNAENIWCKQNLRNLKRYDKISDKKTHRSSLNRSCPPSRKSSTSNLLLTPSLEVFLHPKKGVSPITYKPPLPLPATRRTVQSVVLARSQPGLAQVTRSSAGTSSRSQTTRTTVTRPQLDSVPKNQRRKPVDSTTVAR